MSTIKAGKIQPPGDSDPLQIFTNTVERMTVTSGGLVGVGTVTPEAKLEINGTPDVSTAWVSETTHTSRPHLLLRSDIGNTIPEIQFMEKTNKSWALGGNGPGYGGANGTFVVRDDFQNGNPVRLAITRTGRVGIGTTGPTATLHVKTANIGEVTTLAGINSLSQYSLVLDGITANGGGYTPVYNGTGIAFAATSTSVYPLASIFYDGRGSGGSLNFATTQSYTDGLNKINMTMHNGNVGIGVTGPVAALDVLGNNGQVWIRAGGGGALDASAGSGLKIEYVSSNNQANIQAFNYSTGAARLLTIQNQGGGILLGGNVGIGISASYQLELSTNSAAKPTGGSWINSSDARLKTVLGNWERGLEDVCRLRPVKYRLNGKYGTIDDGKEHVSVIAQEAAQVIPEMVGTFSGSETPESDPVTLYNLDASCLQWCFVNAIKELKAIVEAQAARIAALEGN